MTLNDFYDIGKWGNKLEKIVYLLGAGFSAPLGLPVMSNFISMSKDLFTKYPDRFEYFLEIFKKLNELNKIKNYFQSDLLNIEEVLSVLDMDDQIVYGRSKKDLFIKYLSDVIKFYTPDLNSLKNRTISRDIHELLYRHPDEFSFYINFLLSLNNLSITKNENIKKENDSITYSADYIENPQARYLVISLNYDIVIENFMNLFSERLKLDQNKIVFSRPRPPFSEKDIMFDIKTRFAKIHGSVDENDIIPPTWSKSISSTLQANWQIAQMGIMDATQIRILGYSLPSSDSYIKYLLKSAIVHSFNLKKIDIICLDHEDEVKNRFFDFIRFRDCRFINANILFYFTSIFNENFISSRSKNETVYNFSQIEKVHNDFMSKNISRLI